MSYTVTEYDPATGQLGMSWGYSTLEGLELNVREGMGYVDGKWDSRTHYILNGQATERPTSPVTLSDLTLLGVPAGSTLTINGERYDNVTGDVELEFPLLGTYRLRVECFPYKDCLGEVVVP
jgi:hypothetical protein